MLILVFKDLHRPLPISMGNQSLRIIGLLIRVLKPFPPQIPSLTSRLTCSSIPFQRDSSSHCCWSKFQHGHCKPASCTVQIRIPFMVSGAKRHRRSTLRSIPSCCTTSTVLKTLKEISCWSGILNLKMIVEGELLLERNLELKLEHGMGTVSQGSIPFSGYSKI